MIHNIIKWGASVGVLVAGAVAPAMGNLIFSEIMYNPGSSQPNWEWVELHNTGSTAVDLTGYVFDDDDATILSGANIPGGTIPAGGTAVLFNDTGLNASDVHAAWGADVPLISVTEWPTLDNGGDVIALWDSFAHYGSRTLVNALIWMFYDDASPWPASVTPASITLTSPDADFSAAASWSKSVVGTDGAYKSTLASGNGGNDVGSPGYLVPEPTLLSLAPLLALAARRRHHHHRRSASGN